MRSRVGQDGRRRVEDEAARESRRPIVRVHAHGRQHRRARSAPSPPLLRQARSQ